MRIVETFRCDFSSRRRDELFTNATSSDDERRRDAGGIRRPRTETPGFNVKKRASSGGITGLAASSSVSAASVPSSANKKILDRKADLNKSSAASVAAGTVVPKRRRLTMLTGVRNISGRGLTNTKKPWQIITLQNCEPDSPEINLLDWVMNCGLASLVDPRGVTSRSKETGSR